MATATVPIPEITISPPTPPSTPPPTSHEPSPPTSPSNDSPASSLEPAVVVTAAVQVYRIPELRGLICAYSGLKGLAKILRLEKCNSVLVVPHLYSRVPDAVAKRIKRNNHRGLAYCAAVRVLDLSPSTHLLTGQDLHSMRLRDSPKRDPELFNPAPLSSRLPALRRRYPGLRCLVNQYPSIDLDERYIAQLDDVGALRSVSVETVVEYDINCYFTTISDAPILPPPPVYVGLVVAHTLLIRLVDGGLPQSYGSDRRWRKDAHAVSQRQTRWKTWLYGNGGPDSRVTGIEQQSVPSRLRFDLSHSEALIYVNQRQANLFAPLSHFDLACETGVTSPIVIQLLQAIGQDIRVLRINRSCLGGHHEMQSIISSIGRTLPILESIHLDFAPLPPDTPLFNVSPLSGLVNVRTFSCNGHKLEEKGAMARYVCCLGSPSCVFLDPAIAYMDGQQSLDLQVELARRIMARCRREA